MMTTETQLTAFINKQIAYLPIENQILERVVAALEAAGNPVVSVWDTEDDNPVTSLRDIQEQVFNLDVAYLCTERGGWVMLVLGNEWDALSDYTLSLEEPLKPVMDWIMENF